MKLSHLCIYAPWRWFQSKQKQFDTLLVRRWCTIYINLSYPTLSSSTLIGLTRRFSACSRRKLRKHPSATRFNKTPLRPLNRRFITNMTHMTAYLLAFCFLQKADLVPSKMFYVWHRPNDLQKECISPATEASIVALWGNLKTGGQIPTSWNHWERCAVPSFFLGFQKLPEVLGKKNPPILKSATWKLQWDFLGATFAPWLPAASSWRYLYHPLWDWWIFSSKTRKRLDKHRQRRAFCGYSICFFKEKCCIYQA